MVGQHVEIEVLGKADICDSGFAIRDMFEAGRSDGGVVGWVLVVCMTSLRY